jgi:hypothetical protein
MWTRKNFGAVVLISCVAARPCNCAELTSTNDTAGVELKTQTSRLWDGEIGEGFRSSSETLSLQAGALIGVRILGGSQRHDMVLSSFSYGHMLGETVGRGTWHRGNWELRGELFGGVEYSPSHEWVIGVTPHLRYDFATGSRWVPFADLGAGATATSIRQPDLGNTFEFNLQAAVGTHVFLRDNLALTIEARYVHLSSAGIWSPNLGVNGVLCSVGLAVLF